MQKFNRYNMINISHSGDLTASSSEDGKFLECNRFFVTYIDMNTSIWYNILRVYYVKNYIKKGGIIMNQRTKKTVAITVAALMVLGLFSSIISAFASL